VAHEGLCNINTSNVSSNNPEHGLEDGTNTKHILSQNPVHEDFGIKKCKTTFCITTKTYTKLAAGFFINVFSSKNLFSKGLT
jgi:hypothetical protein